MSDTDQEPSATLIALQSLPERDQEILRLVAWDDLSVGDAAEVLGCSKTNAAVRLHRARGRIRPAPAAQATGTFPTDTPLPALEQEMISLDRRA